MDTPALADGSSDGYDRNPASNTPRIEVGIRLSEREQLALHALLLLQCVPQEVLQAARFISMLRFGGGSTSDESRSSSPPQMERQPGDDEPKLPEQLIVDTNTTTYHDDYDRTPAETPIIHPSDPSPEISTNGKSNPLSSPVQLSAPAGLESGADEAHFFKCNKCDKSFPKHQQQGGHQTLHRAKTRAAPAESAAPSSSRLNYECSICGKKFETGQALGGHKRKHYNDPNHRVESPAPAGASSSSNEGDGEVCYQTPNVSMEMPENGRGG